MHETKINAKLYYIFLIKLDCIFETLIGIIGFSNTWCNWIKQVIKLATVCELIDSTNPYFTSSKSSERGRPYPLYYIIFVDDVRTIIVLKAQDSGIVIGHSENLIHN